MDFAACRVSLVPLLSAAVCLMLLAPPATAQWDDEKEDEWEEEERRDDEDDWEDGEDGEDDEDEIEQQAPSEGDWALMFQVRSPILNVNLSSFQGGVLSGKYHYSETSALRFGLRLSGRVIEEETATEAEQEFVSPGGTSEEGLIEKDASDNNDFLIGVESQYIVYPSLDDDLGMYLGAGPSISLRLSSTERTYRRRDTTAGGAAELIFIQRGQSEGTTLSFGGRGVVGGEWFFHRHMSLSAEYGIILQYEITNETATTDRTNRTIEINGDVIEDIMTTTSETDRSGWRLDGTGVRLGFTLYF